LALTDAPVVSATDGDYTDRIEVTWNTVSGATHYKLFASYVNDPETSTPRTVWITSTSHTDGGATRGVYRYYWVKAAMSMTGMNETGYGPVDAGWRKLEEVQDIQAIDGTSTDHIEISWDNNIWADYYKIYRHNNYTFIDAEPISYWMEENEYNDSSALPAGDLMYWVVCAKDTSLSSDQGSAEVGWRKYYPVEVEATDGVYADHVQITWDPPLGDPSSYQVGKGPKFSSAPTEILAPWSSTLNFEYNDYSVIQGVEYEYFVSAAYNNYGYKPGEYGINRGVADQCANITEDPDPSFRSIDITGNFNMVSRCTVNCLDIIRSGNGTNS